MWSVSAFMSGKRAFALTRPSASRSAPWRSGSFAPGFTAQQSSMFTYW